MKTLLNTTLSAVAAMVISFNAAASGAGVHLDHANTDITDEASLQRGAQSFMNYCSGCHSIELMRYNRIAKDLNIDEADMAKNLMFNAEKTGSTIFSSMPDKGAKEWFGTTPPDLSLTARARGTDWIYTYLKGFYADDTRPYGVNNHVLENASMPDVLWQSKQDKSEQDFNQEVRDITNFLDYVSEPVKLIRYEIGVKVLGFLFILFILSYLLKKEYWKDVKYGKWRAKD
ncbi:MAG: cytochrome c1 [Candidatus Thioglobus sp.]|jgi:ubiquinol-cytochrome c reductase cytochrome c1 subunit|nr:cytochrome c1 [Candidatus Thioglobus sp.]MBT3446714.1 cytochrome c1 [Candidatus Thioglobus sp.]MBT3745299.1 cytochrome c1 [Candidatus Thioglobus sp.]MBT4001009.1 cytochrome c1 [Candidatus Thioglobus sp.]MBT4181619.1 cytochrome c1 [Candidatus Thioglobus sp.]